MRQFNATASGEIPEARSVRTRWPGLVWAIPLAALLIVAYLGVNWLTNRGVEVVVTFSDAEGITAGSTKVLVKGVEAGRVVDVRLVPGGQRAEVTLRLDSRVKPALLSDAKFWLVGERPTLSDMESVRAAVAGIVIGASPGRNGRPTRRFVGLDQPPVVAPRRAGTTYWLTASTLGSIQRNSPVLYRGQEIGKVVSTGLAALGAFRVQIFLYAPFDRFARAGAQFWIGSPVKLSLSDASISARVSSPAALLQGAVQFELPEAARTGPRSPAGSGFVLYGDQTAAELGPTGPETPYEVMLSGAGSGLAPDAKVTLLGYTVGHVRSARLLFSPGSQRPYTDATVVLYPRQLGIAGPFGDPSAWRGATDRKVAALVAQGYRARLVQSPPLIGGRALALMLDTSARPGALGRGEPYPLLPSSVDRDPMAEVEQIAAKLNRVPIAEIGANLRAITANLARISASPRLTGSIAHLDSTLRQADAMMAEVRPRIVPLMAKLDQAAGEVRGTAAAARALVSGEGAGQDQGLPDAIRQLDETARSIRALTDYLGRHPEALIRGKTKQKDSPK